MIRLIRVYMARSPNGNRISKLITAVYKVNRQDKTRQSTDKPLGLGVQQSMNTGLNSMAPSAGTAAVSGVLSEASICGGWTFTGSQLTCRFPFKLFE